MLAANRATVDQPGEVDTFSTRELRPADAPAVSTETVDSIDAVLRSDDEDGALEQRFEHGLRRLVTSYLPAPPA